VFKCRAEQIVNGAGFYRPIPKPSNKYNQIINTTKKPTTIPPIVPMIPIFRVRVNFPFRFSFRAVISFSAESTSSYNLAYSSRSSDARERSLRAVLSRDSSSELYSLHALKSLIKRTILVVWIESIEFV